MPHPQIVSIKERRLLMAIAEGEVYLDNSQIGEDIHQFWMDADPGNPSDYDLSEIIEELSNKYSVQQCSVEFLLESIRLIIVKYDGILDNCYYN